nr:hypothetical protein [Tanacetum cinerariifolium]
MLNKDNYVPWSSCLLRYARQKLNDQEAKQMEADDQAIQTILMGLPEDIYDAVHRIAPPITNQNENGNLVAAWAKSNANGNNGFPTQSIKSSNAIALDLPNLLVLITGTSQSSNT